MNVFFLLFTLGTFSYTTAFIPNPLIAWGGGAKESLTHTEMVQLGLTRTLIRYFIDTHLKPDSNIGIGNFSTVKSIEELYKLVYPNWTPNELDRYSWPLKSAITQIQAEVVKVDLIEPEKSLPSAHFDAEKFADSNRRIMKFRQQVINDINTSGKDLKEARRLIGNLLHTVQDFYTHSNWVEMGKTTINTRIGLHEDIGRVATPDQATCTSTGCTELSTKCDFLLRLVFKKPVVLHHDCKNNILADINDQGILTSGYVLDQLDENGKQVKKPNHVDKCSHGGAVDSSSLQSPIGGINKDASVSLYSPHYYLHAAAAKLAIEATDYFFETLRQEIGNVKFNRLLSITPTAEQLDTAAFAIDHHERFPFFIEEQSLGLDDNSFDFDQLIKQRNEVLQAVVDGVDDIHLPTFDTSDFWSGINKFGIDTNTVQDKPKKRVHKRKHRTHKFY